MDLSKWKEFSKRADCLDRMVPSDVRLLVGQIDRLQNASRMIEELAALEHEQWAHWTKYMLDNLTPENIERWKRQTETSYSDLSETEKESDRGWARKVQEILES